MEGSKIVPDLAIVALGSFGAFGEPTRWRHFCSSWPSALAPG